jgi:two-component system nitrogen regulation response regulator NtrX
MEKSTKSHKPIALIVDDETAICETLAGVLSDEGWESYSATSGEEGLQLFRRSIPDIVLLDVWMDGMDGIEALQKMKALNDRIPIVVMSGHGNIETAVRATKLGAFDFLEKPLSLEKLLPMIEHAKEASAVRRQQAEEFGNQRYDIIGDSEEIQKIKRQIRVIAPRNSWVLITGENGSGKEMVARNIHIYSKRVAKPFVAVNCAAIPEELIESELFGHAKGAFTNAVAMKRGKFELAHHGTLFLDEIGDMSLKTQAKVLRILQEQSFERVGGDETINVDVRVIAATNKNLHEEIKAGRFREDLFYRLNVIPVEMPALRQRKHDVPALASYFLEQMAQELNEKKKFIEPDAMKILKSYSWPGNIREFKNIVERLCILVVDPVIRASDLPDLLGKDLQNSDESAATYQVSSGASLKTARSEFERFFILDRLEENDWNVSKTADAIGIERSNLHRKLRAYNIDPKRLKG